MHSTLQNPQRTNLSRVAPATPPADDAAPPACHRWDWRKWEWLADCDSFLASTAVHLVALILLGLLAASADRPPAVQRVEVQLGTGNDAALGDEGRLAGQPDLDADIANEVAAATSAEMFAPTSVTPPTSSATPSATATDVASDTIASNTDPFGDTTIASDLEAALGTTGLGGSGLGDEGDGKDRWTGDGSPWGKNGPGADFFGIDGRGGSFVYVVDASGSMNEEGKYERARAELLRSIESLNDNQRYYIIFYNDGWYPMDADHPVRATHKQIDRTRRWVNRVWPGGGTFPLEALLHALSLEPDAIYFLSDGRFDPAVIETLAQKNPKRFGQVPIHTIAFVNQETINLMKKIARQSGGKFRFVQ